MKTETDHIQEVCRDIPTGQNLLSQQPRETAQIPQALLEIHKTYML